MQLFSITRVSNGQVVKGGFANKPDAKAARTALHKEAGMDEASVKPSDFIFVVSPDKDHPNYKGGNNVKNK